MNAVALAREPQLSLRRDRLDTLLRMLAEPRRAIEQRFLDMGQQLLGCTTLLNEISAAHEAIPAELESEAFNTAAQHLETIRGEMEQLAATLSGEGNHLVQLARLARDINEPVTDLRRGVRAIRLIAVNARIVAADIQESQYDFGTFTEDMTALGSSVEKAVTAFAKAYDGLTANLDTAQAANAAFVSRHRDTIGLIAERLASHLNVADDHRARSRARAGDQKRLNDQIRSRVAAAVGALQIGDITRQRVEHVEEALQAAGAYAGEHAANVSPAAIQTVSAICHLQAMQIEGTLSDFDAQIADLAQSLEQLTADAGAILRAGGEEAETLLSARGTALNAMIKDLDEIRRLFEDFGRTRAEIERMADGVARAVTVMVGHLDAIGEIEKQIHLLSLNTTIHCGRLGQEGQALRVISQDLHELAEQTVASADAVMSGLREAEGLARDLGKAAAGDVVARVATLKNDAGTAAGLFEDVTQRLHGHVAAMTDAGPRVLSQLAAARDCVSGRRDFVAPWREAVGDIVALAPLERAKLDWSAVDGGVFQTLRKRYTMDSERRLHDAMLGTDPAPVGDGAPAAGEDADIDDLLF